MKNRSSPSVAWKLLRGVGIVALAMIAAIVVRKCFLGGLGTHIIWVTFYPAVVVASFCGGWFAGGLCAVASCVFASYGWPMFGEDPFLKDTWSWLGMVSFLINCATFATAAEIARRARRRAVQTVEQAKAATKALEAENAERARAEQQLRWKTAFLEAQVNSSIDAIVVVDPDLKLALHNQRFIDLFKISANLADEKDTESRFRWIADMTANPEQYLNLVRHIYARVEEARHDECELKDGRVLDRYTAPVVGNDGTYYGRIWTFRDITERKKAELEIERLAAFPRFNPNPVLELSATGKIDYWNHAAEAMIRDLGLETPGQMLPPDFAAMARECLAAGTPKLRVETHIEARVISWSLFPIKSNNRVHCYGGDITDRRRTEEALRASQQTVAEIINAISVRVFWKDKNLVYMGCNAVFARDAGFEDPNDIIGKDDYQMVWRDQAESYQKDDRQVIESGCPKLLIEELQTTPDGNTITLLTNKVPLHNSKREIEGVVVTYMDITERKRDVEALRKIKLQLAHAMSLAQLVAWEYDVATGLFTFDDTYYALHGTTAALENGNQMSAQDFARKFLHPDDAHLVGEEIAKAVAAANPDYHSQVEARIFRRDGELRHVLVHISIIKDAAGRTVEIQGANQDITESKKAQAKLDSIHKQLVESSRLVGMAEIATNVLHNVGNALNSVNISTDLILDGIKKSRASSLAKVVALLQEHAHELGAYLTDDAAGRNVPVYLAHLSECLVAEQRNMSGELDSLRRNVEHIKSIVAMQQDYAAVAGMKELSDIGSLVEDSIRMNEDALRRHGVEVVRELERMPAMNVEKHKILQILVNLVRNAKYACSDAERPDKRLTLRLARENGLVRITVADNGVGIPPENLTRIFNYGFTTRKHGHGFGLHGSALAAKEMGGSLTVHSDGPGQGAAFTLELPCPKQEPPHE